MTTATPSDLEFGAFVDPRSMEVDLDGMRAAMGLGPEVKTLTFQDLQQRRETVSRRMVGTGLSGSSLRQAPCAVARALPSTLAVHATLWVELEARDDDMWRNAFAQDAADR